MSNNETSIHSLHLKMREELQSVVYTTTSLGGILGFLVSLTVANITDVRRFVLIVCGCLAGLYIGRLRKKDINEKRLIVSSQLDLLDLLQQKPVVEESKPTETKEQIIPLASESIQMPESVAAPVSVEATKQEAEPKEKPKKVAMKRKPKG